MATEFSHNEEQTNAQKNIQKEWDTSEKMSLAEVIDKLSEIVRNNEDCMAQAFANAPEWQSRAKMTMTTFSKDELAQKSAHTVVNVPSTFSKEQKDALKEYARQMGGTYTNIKVVEPNQEGSESILIEFGNEAAYKPEVCAKMLLGEEKDAIIKEILASNAAHKQKQMTIKDNKEKKRSNSEEQKTAYQMKSGHKL